MNTLQRWYAVIRWWWRMPVRTHYPVDRRSPEFHEDTKRWWDERPQ